MAGKKRRAVSTVRASVSDITTAPKRPSVVLLEAATRVTGPDRGAVLVAGESWQQRLSGNGTGNRRARVGGSTGSGSDRE